MRFLQHEFVSTRWADLTYRRLETSMSEAFSVNEQNLKKKEIQHSKHLKMVEQNDRGLEVEKGDVGALEAMFRARNKQNQKNK